MSITMTSDICDIITKYIQKPRYELLEWVDIKKLDWEYLSINPNAISLLEANQDKINWHLLSGNPNAIALLEANQDKINWCILSRNHNALSLIKANIEKIDYQVLLSNPNPEVLKLIINKSKWQPMHTKKYVKVYRKNIKSIVDWYIISSNPEAITILSKNPEKIDYKQLSLNPAIFRVNDDKIELIKKTMEIILIK